MSKDTECDVHNWFWSEDDEYGCPVCEGAEAERERIIALLETKAEYFMDCWDEEYDTAGLIALIKGENE